MCRRAVAVLQPPCCHKREKKTGHHVSNSVTTPTNALAMLLHMSGHTPQGRAGLWRAAQEQPQPDRQAGAVPAKCSSIHCQFQLASGCAAPSPQPVSRRRSARTRWACCCWTDRACKEQQRQPTTSMQEPCQGHCLIHECSSSRRRRRSRRSGGRECSRVSAGTRWGSCSTEPWGVSRCSHHVMDRCCSCSWCAQTSQRRQLCQLCGWCRCCSTQQRAASAALAVAVSPAHVVTVHHTL